MRLPLSWGSSAGGQLGREGGEPGAGLHLQSKGQGLECGPTPDPTSLTHPHPKQKASQPLFIPEVPVFNSHLCKCDGKTGKEGSKSRAVLALAWALAWAALQGVYGRAGTPWVGATSQGDRFLGALLRKACSSSSWRTPRSRKGGRRGSW